MNSPPLRSLRFPSFRLRWCCHQRDQGGDWELPARPRRHIVGESIDRAFAPGRPSGTLSIYVVGPGIVARWSADDYPDRLIAPPQLLPAADWGTHRYMAVRSAKRTDSGTTALMSSSESTRRLAIYLSDHRAGAAAGLKRAERFADANAGDFLGDSAAEVCRQIGEDVATLDEIISRLGCHANRLKNAVARGAELLGRLKPNGQLRGYSPLSRLVELELLIAGILTKESLWQSLAVVQHHRAELSRFDFDDLQRRAMQQRIELEAHRDQTVNAAIGI